MALTRLSRVLYNARIRESIENRQKMVAWQMNKGITENRNVVILVLPSSNYIISSIKVFFFLMTI